MPATTTVGAIAYGSDDMVPGENKEIITLSDEMVSESIENIVEDIEEGEAPGLCAVCCQLEPPGFDPDATGAGDSECPVCLNYHFNISRFLFYPLRFS